MAGVGPIGDEAAGEIGVGGANEGGGAGAGEDVERTAGEHAGGETKVARGAAGELLSAPGFGGSPEKPVARGGALRVDARLRLSDPRT